MEKCTTCKKKSLIIITCKCEKTICLGCRPATQHSCTFDYTSEAQKSIKDANPIIKTPKLEKL